MCYTDHRRVRVCQTRMIVDSWPGGLYLIHWEHYQWVAGSERDAYVVPVAARPEHSGIVGSQLYYTWERRGTGWTPGTTHTNTATRRIKWSGACTGAATVYIWAEGLDFTDATWSKPVHKSCRCRKCNYKHSFRNKHRHFLLFKTHSLLLYSTFGSN